MSSSRVHTFYLIRHGETVGNLAKIFNNPEEEILSPGGINEAELLGEALKDVEFDTVHCSDFPRGVQTTEVILSKNRYSEISFTKDARLREINLGKFERGPHGPAFIHLFEFLQKGGTYDEWQTEGSETIPMLKARSKNLIQELFEKLDKSEKNENVLLVAHGILNFCFLKALNEMPDIIITNWDDSCGKLMSNATYMQFTISSKNSDSKRELIFVKIHERLHLNARKEEGSLSKTVNTKEGKPFSGCVQV